MSGLLAATEKGWNTYEAPKFPSTLMSDDTPSSPLYIFSQGAFATVYRAVCIPKGQEVAVKVIALEQISTSIEDLQVRSRISLYSPRYPSPSHLNRMLLLGWSNNRARCA